MFYLAVEEHVMQNRQHELAKELELKRQFRDSLKTRPDDGLYLRAKAGDWLRNLTSVFRTDADETNDSKMSLDCVVC